MIGGGTVEERGSGLPAAATLLIATVGVWIAGWNVSPTLGLVLMVPVLVAMAYVAVRRPYPFFAAALLSTLTGVDPARSLRHDVGYLIGLLLAAAVVVVTVHRSDLLLLASAVCVGGTILCVTAVTSIPDLQVESSDASLIVNRPVGVFGQPNELGLAAAMTFCFSLAMTVVAHRRRRAWMTTLFAVAG